jgi:proline iminopeptidase
MFFPAVEPYQVDYVKVSELHTLYVEKIGKPGGIPIVFLHGGPGGGIDSSYRRYFDPDKFDVTLFDQRGCGKSAPHAELRENTTWDLVEDIELLRKKYGHDEWWVMGGSWGSTLALAYAQKYPESCLGLVLRGIFMCRRHELLWFYQQGASRLFPEYWEPYQDLIPVSERDDMIAAYHRRLTSADPQVRLEAARRWSVWEASTSCLKLDTSKISYASDDHFAEAFARIECHYFMNSAFLEVDDQLLRDMGKISHLPGFIVHGRYDVVCPVENAWDLSKRWPRAKLQISPDAGHSLAENSNAKATMEYLKSIK